MESLNKYSIVDDVGQHYRLKYHSEEALKEQTKLQHQQVVLGLDKKSVLQQKDKGDKGVCIKYYFKFLYVILTVPVDISLSMLNTNRVYLVYINIFEINRSSFYRKVAFVTTYMYTKLMQNLLTFSLLYLVS